MSNLQPSPTGGLPSDNALLAEGSELSEAVASCRRAYDGTTVSLRLRTTIQTVFVERVNLTLRQAQGKLLRQSVARLARRRLTVKELLLLPLPAEG
jgi:hypothetical protein